MRWRAVIMKSSGVRTFGRLGEQRQQGKHEGSLHAVIVVLQFLQQQSKQSRSNAATRLARSDAHSNSSITLGPGGGDSFAIIKVGCGKHSHSLYLHSVASTRMPWEEILCKFCRFFKSAFAQWTGMHLSDCVCRAFQQVPPRHACLQHR